MARRKDAERMALSRRVQRLLGQRIQTLRRNGGRGISQADLALALGISRTSVSNIERGKHRIFLDQVYAAAHRLGVEVGDLLPEMRDIFPESAVNTAPHARVTQASVREISQLTKQIQQRVLNQPKTASSSNGQ